MFCFHSNIRFSESRVRSGTHLPKLNMVIHCHIQRILPLPSWWTLRLLLNFAAMSSYCHVALSLCFFRVHTHEWKCLAIRDRHLPFRQCQTALPRDSSGTNSPALSPSDHSRKRITFLQEGSCFNMMTFRDGDSGHHLPFQPPILTDQQCSFKRYLPFHQTCLPYSYFDPS